MQDKYLLISKKLYRIRFNKKTYYWEQRTGKWYNRKWIVKFMTINKTQFIRYVSKMLAQGDRK